MNNFWDDLEKEVGAIKANDSGAAAPASQQISALNRSFDMSNEKRRELVVSFLMGAHARLGHESDIRILTDSGSTAPRKNPFEIIGNMVIFPEDQEIYLKDISKRRGKIEDYLFEKRIGKGTYGKVYQAIHRRTGYQVAVKALKKKKIAAQKMTEKV
mmetsp:Transcript_89185/g.238118  ORF Transcript_89185/g.238118 Transcript_89185/m.238118 type:complete len:157 (-) Transcript_89185:1247-1717(-)